MHLHCRASAQTHCLLEKITNRKRKKYLEILGKSLEFCPSNFQIYMRQTFAMLSFFLSESVSFFCPNELALLFLTKSSSTKGVNTMDNKLQFRCNDSFLAKIDAFAANHDMSRSEAIRNLIGIGLTTNVVAANEFKDFLLSLGYEKLSEIPSQELDNVTGKYLEWAKSRN